MKTSKHWTIVFVMAITIAPGVAIAQQHLPSQKEFYAAGEALKVLDFAPAQRYFEQRLAWYEDAMVDRFDPDTFIAEMKAKGQPVNADTVQRFHAILLSIQGDFKPDAAEAAWWLGTLKCLEFKYGEAVPYYHKAVQWQPENERYATALRKVMEEVRKPY